MTVMPALLPMTGIPGAQAKVWNAVMSYRGHPLPLAGQNVAAQFQPIDPPADDLPAMLLQFGAGFRALLALTAFPFDKVFGTPFSIDDLRGLPVSLRDALNEGILAMLWGALPEHRLRSYVVQANGTCGGLMEPQALRSLAWFDVQITGLQPDMVSLVIGIPPNRLTDVLVQGDIAPRKVWPGLSSRIAQDVAYTLGRLILTASEARLLKQGDVVVLGRDEQDVCRVRSSNRIYRFNKSESGWTAAGVEPTAAARLMGEVVQGDTMSQTDFNATAPLGAGLQVVVDFDLGHQSVPLSEIESWQPGALVQLDPPATGNGVEVTVRANGHVIGLGDLVRIDDRLAVRLNRLFLDTKAAG